MRSQRRELLRAVSAIAPDGAVRLDAPFLILAETLEIIGQAAKYLHGIPSKVNRNTVQAWLRDGVVPETKRSDRNRLFSVLDVVRLATVFYINQWGLSAKVGAWVGEQVVERVKSDPSFFGKDGVDDPSPANLLVLRPDGRNWVIEWPKTADEIVLNGLRGFAIVLNFRQLVGFIVAIALERFHAKAKALLAEHGRGG